MPVYPDGAARVHPALRKFAVVLNVVCGVSYEKIGAVWHVWSSSAKWVQAEAASVEEPMQGAKRIVMMDDVAPVNGKQGMDLACH